MAIRPGADQPDHAGECADRQSLSEWDVSGAGDPSIQGFATDISVNKGETVSFKVKTDSAITASTSIGSATVAPVPG
jgi:hypothetical protein